MRKPGTDPQNVQMTDVVCDFCRREWTEDLPLIEGHQGSCMCGNCLTLAYAAVVLHSQNSAPAEFRCPMCLETAADRKSLDRGDEPGWQSPVHSEAVICLRCIELAAKALERDRDWNWKRPDGTN